MTTNSGAVPEEDRPTTDRVPPKSTTSVTNTADTWWNGYNAGLRCGWLDCLDFVFEHGASAMNATVLDELVDHLRGDAA